MCKVYSVVILLASPVYLISMLWTYTGITIKQIHKYKDDQNIIKPLLNQSHAEASKNQIMKEITTVTLHLDFYRLW